MSYRNLIDLDDVAAGNGGIKITGENARDFAGRVVAGGFDINGDGFDDLIVGAYGNDGGGNYAGAAYVVFGKSTGFSANVNLDDVASGGGGFKIQGQQEPDRAGISVSSAGDVNSDGFDDIQVGTTNGRENGLIGVVAA